MRILSWVPIFALVSLVLMFFMLPDTPDLFFCKLCSSHSPYLPLLGAGYFSILFAVAFLFPSFPKKKTALAGLVFALLLASLLTYMNWPAICYVCLTTHGCHIAIWTLWMLCARPAEAIVTNRIERQGLVLLSAITVVALFASLNLTFMVYGYKFQSPVAPVGLHVGDEMPSFEATFSNGDRFNQELAKLCKRTIINFIAPDCPYCKQQLPIVQSVITQMPEGNYRFINVISKLSEPLKETLASFDLVEDVKGNLRELFKVSLYPTLFVIDSSGKIRQIIQGVPERLSGSLAEAFTE